MARTIDQIKEQIITKISENEVVASKLTSDSAVSIWRQFVFAVAFCIWFLESLWDVFKNEMEAEMAKQKIHSKQWYSQKALDFQYGFSMIPDTDQFDNSGASDAEIQASKIIKQADCVKLISSTGYGILRVKVASEDINGNLQSLTTEQHNAVKYYFMRKVTDAGTQLKVTTAPADKLKLKIDVYFDPLVLSTTGSRLDGSDDSPVINKINEFLKSIGFNGALVINKLEQSLHEIEGVEVATNIVAASSKYGDFDYTTTGVVNVGLINAIRIADSGYMELDTEALEINYIVMPD
jgi:hypothetical protein